MPRTMPVRGIRLCGARSDLGCDVIGVASHTADESRAQCVEEQQAHEVEARLRLHHAPLVNRIAVLGEDGRLQRREVLPAISGTSVTGIRNRPAAHKSPMFMKLLKSPRSYWL